MHVPIASDMIYIVSFSQCIWTKCKQNLFTQIYDCWQGLKMLQMLHLLRLRCHRRQAAGQPGRITLVMGE